MKAAGRSRTRFGVVLAGIVAASFAVRIAYVLAQPASDPSFARPMLDGAYYWRWAESIRGLRSGFEGVYYLGPLYPWALAAFQAVGAGFTAVYVAQHLAMAASATLLSIAARRAAGDAAGIACAVLALSYHPTAFFASRPLSEPLGILLLSASVLAAMPSRGIGKEEGREAFFRLGAAGFLAGMAALARPSFLPVPALWASVAASRRRFGAAAALVVGAAVAVAPVTLRNIAVSGHVVPVSANSGIVLWLGNAPGAAGVYVPAEGFSGDIATQQEEAMALARTRTGRRLDAVESDRYWFGEAVRARLADPGGTMLLLGRRLMLTLDDAEQGLDYAPSLDRDPIRRLMPLTFAPILGLAVAGLVLGGIRRSGGGAVWGAVAGCAATPLIFYVSSRHRLPLVLLLTIPASTAVADLLRRTSASSASSVTRDRRVVAAVVSGAALASASLAFPTAGLVRIQRSAALANLGSAYHAGGDDDRAESALREALLLDAESVAARYNLAVILAQRGREAEAERLYREVLASDPGHAETAGNLAGILVRRGDFADGISMLRRALEFRPGHAACRANLVVTLALSGDLPGAREAASEARRAGVMLDPELLREIGWDDAGEPRAPEPGR